MTTSALTDFIRDQLATDAKDSKKFIAMGLGMGCMLFIFIVSVILFYLRPDIAAQVVSLATTAITADGGLIGIYVTGQAVVEFKANSVLQATQENKRPDVIIRREVSKKVDNPDE